MIFPLLLAYKIPQFFISNLKFIIFLIHIIAISIINICYKITIYLMYIFLYIITDPFEINVFPLFFYIILHSQVILNSFK